jgi:tRNA nucleotidyltransferase (CCA-adding enzyme)
VDVERHYKGKKPELNQSKVGPLILIDPVQPLRNAAAAVSLQTFSRFVAAARNFIKNPSQRFFEKRQITEAKLKEAAGKNRLIMLELGLKRAKLDVNGARIVKALEFVDSRLKENDFKVFDKGWIGHVAKAMGWCADRRA